MHMLRMHMLRKQNLTGGLYMSRKLICLVLAVCMVLGLALTGCKSGDSKTTTAAASSAAASSAAASSAAASSAADTSAVTPAGEWDTGSIVVEPLGIDLEGADIEFICNMGLNDARTAVWAKAEQYIKTIYNGDVKLTLVDGAEYDSKIKTTFAAGMGADMLWTSYTNAFTELVADEALLPLDDYTQYMPKAFSDAPKEMYGAVTIGGKIYAIIPFKHLVENNSCLYDKTQTDAAGVDLNGWVRWTDNNENFYKLREWVDSQDESRHDIPISTFYDNFSREAVLEVIGSRATCISCNYAGVESVAGYKPYTDLFVPYQTPEFNAFIKEMNQLVIDRIIPYDRSNYDKDSIYRNEGKQIVWSSQGYVFAPDSIVNYPCTLAKQAVSISYSGYTCGSLNSVNAQTEYPEASCKLIEILASDKYLGTIMRFGEEGVHWTLTENGQADCTIGLDTKIKNWYGIQMGDITNCVLPTDVEPTFHEALAEMNANAIFSENLGFNVDSTPVAAEVAAVNATYSEYISGTNILSGMLTDEETDARIKEFNDKLKGNGIDKILTEYQTQLDAWRAAK